MNRNTILAVTAAAASVVALSGCLDTDDPLGPIRQCTLSPATQQDVAGDTLQLAQGPRYIEREQGEAPAAQRGDAVDVCYVARFTNGQTFDAGQLPAAGQPAIVIGEGQLIPGFESGLVGIGVGGVRRLIVPPELGYGSQDIRNPQTGQVVIPANSTLVFDVQLLRIR